MKKLIIFGTGTLAELAYYYFTYDTDFEVVAFTVDRDFAKIDTFMGLPLIVFDDLEGACPPSDFYMFVATGYNKLNEIRMQKYKSLKEKGYRIVSYVSSKAVVSKDSPLGENCFIMENVTIQPFSRVGDNVVVSSGAYIGHHCQIQSHSFIASHAVVAGSVEIGERSFIGINATLRDGIKVGECCVVGAGSLLLRDAADNGVYIGNATKRAPIPSSALWGI